MATPLKGTECDQLSKAQIGALAQFMAFKKRLPEMYATKIGQLRDEFDINLPNEIKGSPLWSMDAKELLIQNCQAAVLMLDRVRVKPRLYEPGVLSSINEAVDAIEQLMFDEVVNGVTECVCARTPDICEQYEVPEFFEAPLIHEEE